MNFLIINLKKNCFTIVFMLFTLSLLLFSDTNIKKEHSPYEQEVAYLLREEKI